MILSEADSCAGHVLDCLRLHCERIEIAGSIRRREKSVGDIEIVCIPKTIPIGDDLFGENITKRTPSFSKVVNGFAHIKGDADVGLFMQRALVDEMGDPEINLDIFTATLENWGGIFAIRTGAKEFSHHCLAKRAHKFGMRFQGGFLTKDGEKLRSEDEGQIFAQLQMPRIAPEFRGTKKVLDEYGVY